MRFTSRRTHLAGAAVAISALFALTACAGSSDDSAATNADGDSLGTLTVGALATPAGDVLKFVEENLAADAGLDITFQEFTDYNTPNVALSDGSIDANLFQNATFLDTYNEQAGGSLVSVGEIYLPSAAFYSNTVTSLDDLEDGASIAIPNDPTNEGRALKILADEGLIETTDEPTALADITENPHKYEFLEIENATLPQAVQDVDVAFVTISFALPAGLTGDQAILLEGSDSPYFNVLATTPELEDDPRIVKLKELLLSDETQQFMIDTWGGLVIPAV
ncbi:MetQ/NlpA family ABC transporter substrate-binding protein [Cryobacterium psychrophilum]|uniref:Lipoprotein n=1 Tax=Cryobacterium psychrophilum TaxID=41988 RepID=A0A4Y8KJP3_9MICO|nr:MetQ/NlpA family ABC transporter substrate-binding protein [Cryobacterium psychrophilum]TDW30503.1 D-methionine transport system substrate-binding protein [Cryobacterium psychrophilum]TFD76324.1 MetQ/NlpA family ABC transporter substrate-binding protein [Cryobacterium psychrophilum]